MLRFRLVDELSYKLFLYPGSRTSQLQYIVGVIIG